MATLAFTTLGNALGGPPGAAIGALIGRQVDGAVFGPSRRGPRLKELEVTLSSYGTAIPRIFGRMRVPGAVIWATELQERSEAQGGGKGQPGATLTSYCANVAVALSSRPIRDIGRIWADGKLLRGAAGDLKVGGTLRIHTGAHAQQPDPLIAASEGEARCPAFRGLAYVVFEALDLADFGNRVPALTFEVIADEFVSLADMLGDTITDLTASGAIDGVDGLAMDDTLGAILATLDPVLPIAIDAGGDTVFVRLADMSGEALRLDDCATSVDDDGFGTGTGTGTGTSRRRIPPALQAPPVLRYLDIDRDYQPGTQHASGRAGPGQPDTIDLPAAMHAAQARQLVERMAFDRDRARETVAWRTTTLDSAIAPGSLVRLPDRGGTWRVSTWEWREAGVELELVRVAPSPTPVQSVIPERFTAPVDLTAATTRLVALELPWDGASGPTPPRQAAAVAGTGPNWSGAALYLDHGDGQLWPAGYATRAPAILGHALTVLAPANPLLMDRESEVTVALASDDQALDHASLAQWATGGNLALIGEELMQFARAEPLGGGHWRLSQFLRGLNGTEAAVVAHVAGESFALLDRRLTALDAGTVPMGTSDVVALGRGNDQPVTSAIHLAGIARRPLIPVHPRASLDSAGTLHLSWARRARGGWRWSDGVDVPLVEEAERYLVTWEVDGLPWRSWSPAAPSLVVGSEELAGLRTLASAGAFHVRQQGTHMLSASLLLPMPA